MKFSQGEITVLSAQPAIDAAVKAVKGGDTTLDFSDIKRVDSAAVALLIEARRHCSPHTALKVQGAPQALQGLISTYGLQSLFQDTFT